jgi:hypothetical protein
VKSEARNPKSETNPNDPDREKSEARNPKSETNPNDQNAKFKPGLQQSLGHLGFEF